MRGGRTPLKVEGSSLGLEGHRKDCCPGGGRLCPASIIDEYFREYESPVIQYEWTFHSFRLLLSSSYQ